MDACIKNQKRKRMLTTASFESLFTNSLTAMLVENQDGDVIDANSSACRLFEINREEIIGQRSTRLIREEDRAMHLSEGPLIFASLDTQAGSRTLVSLLRSPVETSAETASLISLWPTSQNYSCADAEGNHNAEQASVQSASQHIANVISDRLTPIQGFVSLAQAELRQGRFQSSHLQHIATAADRGADFARDLFEFSQVHHEEVILASPGDLIEDLQQELTLIAGDSVTISFNTSQKTPDIRISAVDFRTIMSHAVRNAAANAKTGRLVKITCATDNEHAPPSLTTHSPATIITISDNAPNLSPVSSTNAFSPFFSLPEREDPHGLRLPAVKHLMRSYGGSIQLQSSPENGNSLRLSFPQAHH